MLRLSTGSVALRPSTRPDCFEPPQYLPKAQRHGASIMAFLQRLGLGRHRAQQARLEERVNALQTALSRCKGAATRWRRTQWGLVTGVGITMLAVGYVAGLYSAPVKPAITGVVAQPFASA